MCVSGGWTESYQTRKFFLARVVMNMAFMFLHGRRNSANLPVPRWVLGLVATGAAVSLGVRFTYNDQIKRFWSEIRDDWFANERMLEEDPRN